MRGAAKRRPDAGLPRARRGHRPWGLVLILSLFAAAPVQALEHAAGVSPPASGAALEAEGAAFVAQRGGRPQPFFEHIPPDERPRLEERYRRFQQLPPDQREQLRRRYEEWNRMPPGERERYEQRYRQWQELPPEERRRMEDQLQRWDRLSPQEKDSIRRRFRD